jgi:hypothetical protein
LVDKILVKRETTSTGEAKDAKEWFSCWRPRGLYLEKEFKKKL